MNLIAHSIACTVLLAAVLAVYVYRRYLENHEDHYLHLHNDSHDMNIISAQNAVAKRLELVDRLKNAGIVAVIVYALAIAAMAIYRGWLSSSALN